MAGKILSVVTVAYNSEKFIEECVNSVLKFLPKDSEYVVLDNASTDKTATIIENFSPKIKFLRSESNLGFGKGMNKAIESCEGKFLFLLNPDTNIKADVFTPLIKSYGSSDEVGIVAPRLIKPDGTIQPSVKNLPTIWGAFKEFVLGFKHAYTEYAPLGEAPQIVECVYGAAMLIRKDLFLKIGQFNKDYFLYYEDVALCKKIQEFNKIILYVPGVVIEHIVGGTRSNLDRYKINLKSAKIYHGAVGAYLLQLIFFVPRLKKKLFNL